MNINEYNVTKNRKICTYHKIITQHTHILFTNSFEAHYIILVGVVSPLLSWPKTKNIATSSGLFRGFLSSWGVNLYIEGFSECILCTRIISHWILTGPGMYGHHSILFHLDTRGNSSRRHKTHVDTKTGTADLSDQSSLVSHNMSVRFFLSGYRILNI